MPVSGEEQGFYLVQTGIYRLRSNAERELSELRAQGFPAFLTARDNLYYVRAGAYRELVPIGGISQYMPFGRESGFCRTAEHKISVQKRKKGAFLWQEKIWLLPSAASMEAEEQKSEKS